MTILESKRVTCMTVMFSVRLACWFSMQKKNQLSLSAPARSEPLSLFHCHSPGNSEYKLVFFSLSVSAEEKSTLCCFFFFLNDLPFLFIVSFSK